MVAFGECVSVSWHGRREGVIAGGTDAGGEGEGDEQVVPDCGDVV